MAATQEVTQLSEDQLKTMTPEQIVEAQQKGQLRTLLGGTPTVDLLDNAEQVTADEYKRLTPAQIAQAHSAGRLADVLTAPPGAAPSAPNTPGPLLKQGG